MVCSFEEMKTNSENEELFNVICAQDTISALNLDKIQQLAPNEFIGLNFASSTLDEEELEKRSTFILKNVLKNKYALRLLRRSFSKSNILVIFKSDVSTRVELIQDLRQIGISDTEIDPYELMYYFISELNDSVNTINPLEYKNAEIYALDVVIAKYKTIQKTNKILKFGIEHCQWLSNDDRSSHASFSTLVPVELLVSMCRPVLHSFSRFDLIQLEYFTVKIEHLNKKIEGAQRVLFAEIRSLGKSYDAYIEVIDQSLLKIEEILHAPTLYLETKDTINQLKLQQTSAREVGMMEKNAAIRTISKNEGAKLSAYEQERAMLIAQKKAFEEESVVASQDIQSSACVAPIYNPLVLSWRLSLQKSKKANARAVGQKQPSSYTITTGNKSQLFG